MRERETIQVQLLIGKVAELKGRAAETPHYHAKMQYLKAAEAFDKVKMLIENSDGANKIKRLTNEELIA